MKNNLAKKSAVAIAHGDGVLGIVPIQGQCLQRFGTGTDNDHSPSNLSATKRCGASSAGAAPVTITTHVSNQPYDTRNGAGMPNDRFPLGRRPPRSLARNTRSTGAPCRRSEGCREERNSRGSHSTVPQPRLTVCRCGLVQP